MQPLKIKTKTMGFIVDRLGRYLLLVLILFSGFNVNAKEKGDEYLTYVHEIINSFSKDMQKEYGLICVGSGGRMPHDVEEIDIMFYCYQYATIAEARQLFVTVTEKLVDKINQNEKIRPFLREYPFTSKPADRIFTWSRANISLSFCKKDGSHYLDGSVASVCQARDGKISYDAAELQKRKLPNIIGLDGKIEVVGEEIEREVYIPLLEEPYEEAAKIVKSTQTPKK